MNKIYLQEKRNAGAYEPFIALKIKKKNAVTGASSNIYCSALTRRCLWRLSVKVVRLWGRDMRNNRDEVPLLELAKTNIKDELDEVLLLDNPRILFGEWIPMGANQIFALNDRLGSSERVQVRAQI
jgi:hypothetical protein